MRTNVYIDGFNFYYGAVRGTAYKWLDFAHMCGLLLPKNTIHKIKYFTAQVVARPDDPDQPARQQTYLRALRTIPNLSIVFGHFLSNETSMYSAGCSDCNRKYVRVIKTEEKGSDVNLAVHLLNDGYKRDFDVAIVITNDSDLVEPIKLVRRELGLVVGVLNPHRKPAAELSRHASFVKPIRSGVLAASQFPDILTDTTGQFHKPVIW